MQTVKVYYLNIRQVKGREEYLYSVLPESRVEKAKRFAFEGDRLLSLAAGYLVNRYIGGFFVNEYGKPRSKNAFFNLSHSGDIAALAVSETHEVGVDIEAERDDKDFSALAKYALSEAEFETYESGGHFLALFTAKESLAKAEGKGLKTEMKTIPALPLNGEVEYKGKKYFRHALQFGGYFLSVTSEGEDFTIETEEIFEI